MEEKLAELYNKLANQIVDIIPVEWEEVNYLGEVGKGKLSSGSVFYFKDKNITLQCHKIPEIYHVSKDIYMELFRNLDHILLEIYDCFIEDGQEPWEQLSLSFNAEGKFKIEFFYNVMENPEVGPLAREVIWAYRTFGYEPESSYWKEQLHQYLKKQS